MILMAVKLFCMLLQWWIHAIVHLSVSRVNLNGRYGPWAITMGRCRFTDCNECTSLAWGVDSDGGCVRGGQVHGYLLHFAVNRKLL